MGCPLRMGICVAVWVLVIARAGAQVDIQKRPDSTAVPYPTLQGPRRFISGPTNPGPTYADLRDIGGKVEAGPTGATWVVRNRSYMLRDDTTDTRQTTQSNGHTGGVLMTHAGEATQEMLPIPIRNIGVSTASSGQGADEDPDSSVSGPGENKHPPVTGTESADWARNSEEWVYPDDEWIVMPLPNTAYPALPLPSPPAAVLVAVTNKKVTVEHNVSDLANVTLHYRFYLSDSQPPDTPPELKVYHVVDGARKLLHQDSEQGEWHEQTLLVPQVPQADNSSILFEGWRKGDGNVVALSGVDITGVTVSTDDAPDAGDELTFTSGQPNTTETLPSTPTPEGNQTQDLPAPVEGSVATDAEDQDGNITTLDSPEGTQSDLSLDTTARISQKPAEGEVEEGNVTEVSDEPLEPEVSTDNPQNETRTSEQISGRTDVVALNSSTSGDDTMTSGDSEGDGGESETDEGMPMTTAMPDDEDTTAETVPEVKVDTDQNTDDSSKLPITDLTTDSLPTNASVTLPDGNTTVPGNTSQVPTKTQPAGEGQTVSEGSELTPGTSAAPQSNGTIENVTSTGDGTVPVEGKVSESTLEPSPAVNSTEAVMAVPVSSTSWQVFQVFLVLCVLGLLALGFLYWKRKRRQDDEIPVFTRHTDYHNPTFSMEDAANFMSRSGRNTYKTIE